MRLREWVNGEWVRFLAASVNPRKLHPQAPQEQSTGNEDAFLGPPPSLHPPPRLSTIGRYSTAIRPIVRRSAGGAEWRHWIDEHVADVDSSRLRLKSAMSRSVTLGLKICSVSWNVCDEFWLLLQSKFRDATHGRGFWQNLFLRNLIEFFQISKRNPQRAEHVTSSDNLCFSLKVPEDLHKTITFLIQRVP
jgi:hypothetical protein